MARLLAVVVVVLPCRNYLRRLDIDWQILQCTLHRDYFLAYLVALSLTLLFHNYLAPFLFFSLFLQPDYFLIKFSNLFCS